MQRIPVRSSNLASVGYDGLASTLEVEFTNDTIYRFFGVSEHVYRSLMGASSHGQYFNDHIKDRYRYRQIR